MLLNTRKISFLLFSSLIIFNFYKYGFADDTWELVFGIRDSNLKEVSVDDNNKGVIYAASENNLYRTEDGGIVWREVFFNQTKNDSINFIKIIKRKVFICTKSGVFISDDGKSNWKKIFRGIGDKENNVSHIAFSKDDKIYLATGAGLFISNNDSFEWSKDNIEGDDFGLKWIEFLDGIIFAITEKGVYKNSGAGWKRTFVTERREMEYDADIADELLEAVKPVNSMAIDKDNILLATDSGIFISEDKGETWKRFINAGLISLHIRRILSGSALYAITDRGVFIFSDKDRLWQSLYKGMPTKEANSIAMDSNGNIWVATKKGLYRCKQNIM